ncbi:ribonuclease H-like domain-containing protein [Tanacetum coccineum]|uniref:Ribonuclease H-like domain-containing protein n=1 Tax=Tanacetum coccineum TaxID=301880 RepID=A0ABQ4XA84_9ASTR
MLVPKPTNANVVRSIWLFRHKYHADGSLSRYKVQLVANGRTQQVGIDCDDTFSPVVKPATIRTVLSLALSRGWPVHHLDVKNAFLNGDLYALRVGFSSSRSDSSLFIYQHGSEVAYLLIYFDDIVLTASSMDLLRRIISSLHKEFDMTDLGMLNYLLGISITRDYTGMFLSQKKYALELLKRAHMANYNPTWTPVDTESKLGYDGDPISDPTLYRSLAGGLQYLTFTRPDISYAVQQALLLHIPMLIGRVVLLPGGLHLVIVFSWEISYSHGQPNDNIRSLNRVLKLSTEVLLMLLPKLLGFVIFLENFIHHYYLPPLSIVKISVELREQTRGDRTVISELLKADYRRQRQLVEALKIVKSLKTQMIELQTQQGPAKDPAEPELPKEASSSS